VAGNVRAELRFGGGVLLALVPALLAAVAGHPEQLRQSLVAVVGLALAGCGYLAGRVQLARHHRPEVLTSGISVADVRRARAAVKAADDA
jgi:glucosyl-dolichyl phosphate glucuronosyltransferase